MKFTYIKIITIICILFSFNSVIAQKCKFQEKEDPISGKKIKTIQNLINSGWKINLINEDGKITIAFDLSINGQSRLSINAGDSLFIKLESGDLLRLSADKETAGTPYVFYGHVFTQFLPTYHLKKSQLRKLAASPVTAVRMVLENTEETAEVSEKNGKKISHSADCMLTDITTTQ